MSVDILSTLHSFFSLPSTDALISSLISKNIRTLEISLVDLNSHSSDLVQLIMSSYSLIRDEMDRCLNEFVFEKYEKNLEMNISLCENFVYHSMRELKSGLLRKLITFRGTVTRSSQVRPEIVLGTFSCKVCNAVVENVFQEYKYTEPLTCPNHLCTNRKAWKLDLDQSKFCNWQKLLVQEVTDEIPSGALPRTMEVIVRNELTEKIRPGDTINLTGHLILLPDIVKLMLPQSKSMPVLGGQEQNLKVRKNVNVKDLSYKMAFLATGTDKMEEKEEIFTEEEIVQVQKMRGEDDLYHKLSQSLFPTVHGHYSIKNAILLMLIGGVGKKTKDKIKLRGDINVLLVGDPGTAKSQILKQTSKILSRSVYTSGKSSSAAGLTASVIKDSESGEFSIEAGALMLSDNGICCIDEFDKMDLKDQVAIHEAMEQQTITIAKAGIHATLNARASVLAAANPIHGRYDKRKSLRQNINMSAPIMSRFDLYFVLIDDVDYQSDASIASHILENHKNHGEQSSNSGYFTQEEVKLYIRHARSLRPVIPEETRKEIVKKYVRIRQDCLIQRNNYKMGIRHLESLIRLSEALAKLYGDEEVRVSHVEESFRLLKSSFVEISTDEISVGEETINPIVYERIKNSFLFLLKTQTLSSEGLITKHLEDTENQLETEEAFFLEKKNAENTLKHLTIQEGLFFEEDGILKIHPNYDM